MDLKILENRFKPEIYKHNAQVDMFKGIVGGLYMGVSSEPSRLSPFVSSNFN